jgi:hypothetical protein
MYMVLICTYAYFKSEHSRADIEEEIRNVIDEVLFYYQKTKSTHVSTIKLKSIEMHNYNYRLELYPQIGIVS